MPDQPDASLVSATRPHDPLRTPLDSLLAWLGDRVVEVRGHGSDPSGPTVTGPGVASFSIEVAPTSAHSAGLD